MNINLFLNKVTFEDIIYGLTYYERERKNEMELVPRSGSETPVHLSWRHPQRAEGNVGGR